MEELSSRLNLKQKSLKHVACELPFAVPLAFEKNSHLGGIGLCSILASGAKCPGRQYSWARAVLSSPESTDLMPYPWGLGVRVAGRERVRAQHRDLEQQP
jgi:hypothetical protein